MKILHVLPALTKGGAERVAVDLAKASVAAGHEVSMVLAYPEDPALLQNELDPAVDLRFVQSRSSRASAYVGMAPFVLRNRRWLVSHDIVHCHLTYGSVFATMLSTVAGGTPTVVETYHAVGMAIPNWKRGLHRLLLKGRDGVALMAEDNYWREFRDLHNDRLVRLIPNGVSLRPPADEGAIAELRRIAGVPADVALVGSLGRLEHERRPDALVRAFTEAARHLPKSVHLLLGGEGPARADVEAQANALGLGDRIHYCGLVRDPVAFFGNLDLYLTVNVGPITGIAALEAAMSGLPLIAFQMLPAYAPGPDDWIWSSSDPPALGQRLAALITDSDARNRLASSQQAHALEHHSLDAMARAYDGLYKAALSRHGERKDANQ